MHNFSLGIMGEKVPGLFIENSLEFALYDVIQGRLGPRNIDIYTLESSHVSAIESFQDLPAKLHAHLKKKKDSIRPDGFSHTLSSRQIRHIRTHDVGFMLKHVVSSAHAFQAVPSVARGCLFPQERKLSSGDYSEGDCFLECTWEIASENCGCVPWFLNTRFMHADMCEEYGNRLVGLLCQ